MKKEVGYILHGFFLMTILIASIWVINFLLSIRTSEKPQIIYFDESPQSSATTTAFNQRGQELFQINCSSCHAVLKIIDGPRLSEVEQRVTDRKLLYAWIRNSDAVLKSGNRYFNQLAKEFNNIGMSAFPNLSDADIDSILVYVKQAEHPRIQY